MPSKSKKQQRLFGMVHAYQKGELDNPSQEVKDIAKTISKKDAKDFAETKHKGLPNKIKSKKNESKIMENNTIKLNEEQLKQIVAESVKKVLKEGSSNSRVLEVWDEMIESVGPKPFLDMVYSALSHDTLVDLIKYFNRVYEFGLDINDLY